MICTLKRSPIRRTSLKARRRQREWSKIVAARMQATDGICEAGLIRLCTGKAEHGHHLKLRSQGGKNEEDNCVVLCGACHEYFHRNPAWARQRGYIIGRNGT